jgi:Uma2 family endonuclease
MATTTPITTADQLFHAPDLGRCELVRGELMMMTPAGFEHGRIAGRLAGALVPFVTQHALGVVLVAEAGFQISRDPDTVRAPDVAFVRAERVPATPPHAFFPGAPDLAVEVVSPNDRASELIAKVQDWLDGGCRAVWVVDPETHSITVYRSRNEVMVLTRADTLTGGDVVPGFSVAVRDIFA